MNTLLWILQAILAALFLLSGMMKAATPKNKLQKKMEWVGDFSSSQIKVIGILEVFGAIGLILPMLLNILPVLTPVAASALALTMLFAFVTHNRRNENKEKISNLALLVLAAFIALGRFGLI